MTLFNAGRFQHIEDRQDRIEASVNILSGNVNSVAHDVGNLRNEVGTFSGKLDKIFDTIAGTAENSAERTAAVKTELREEADRKAKSRSSMIQVALALIGASIGLLSFVAVLISAMVNPWKEKVETTTVGQQADTAAISAVREVLAQQGAGIGQVRDQSDDNDKRLRLIEADAAFEKGWMAARYGYPGKVGR